MEDLYKLFSKQFDNKERRNNKIAVRKSELLEEIDQQGLEYLHDVNAMTQLRKSVSREGFSNQDQAITTEEQSEMEQLSALESKFNGLLSQYSSIYKNYSDSVQEYLKANSSAYANKNIRLKNGNEYYVNKYNYAKSIDPSSRSSVHESCPTSFVDVDTDDLSSLKIKDTSSSMKPNEPCGYEGKNIKVTTQQSETVDLAQLNGTQATQSTNYSSSHFPASNAIDNNSSTFNHTLKGVGEWLQVTLPKDCFIEYVVIGNRHNCCVDRFKTVRMDVLNSDGSSVYNSIITNPSGSLLSFRVNNINKMARSIKLTQEEDNFLHVVSVKVYGKHTTPLEQPLAGYINDKNVLQKYATTDMVNNTGTCPSSSSVTNVTADIWNSFSTGNDMNEFTTCGLGNIGKKEKEELVSINSALLETANQIYEKIQELQQKQSTYHKKNDAKETYLSEQLEKYQGLYKKLNNIRNREDTFEALYKDSTMNRSSSNMDFLLWSVITGLLLFYAIRQLRK